MPPDDDGGMGAGEADRAPAIWPAHRRETGRRRLARRLLTGAALVATTVGATLAVRRIGLGRIVGGVLSANPNLVLLALSLMCLAMAARAVAWRAILAAAFPGAVIALPPVLRATSIGVLLSATMPARVGEPARAVIVARSVDGSGRAGVLSRVFGTMVSQTILNVLALFGLGALTFSSYFRGGLGPLTAAILAPLGVIALALIAAPLALNLLPLNRRGPLALRVDAALAGIRAGLVVFRSPRPALCAATLQFGAWALQCLSCYALLAAFGLDHRVGIEAAAAVLLAVNVTAVVPVTPSNLGVFQAACVVALSGAHAIRPAEDVAYGIVLQAVEIATAIAIGGPALVREGLVRRPPPQRQSDMR
jgi:phosphatidyl-myo-inositol alpha-mannosyltransferase